jgi:hypothetical protein
MSWTGPAATISWDNLNQIRVYGQDPEGNIMEWAAGSSGKWTGPNKIGYKAKYGTSMSATLSYNGTGDPRVCNDNKQYNIDTTNVKQIRIYYYGDDGRIREGVYEKGWGGGGTLP